MNYGYPTPWLYNNYQQQMLQNTPVQMQPGMQQTPLPNQQQSNMNTPIQNELMLVLVKDDNAVQNYPVANGNSVMLMNYDGMSRARGRSRTTGRYMSRDSAYDMGRSNHSIKDRMVDSLERMYDEAVTEHERNTIDEWIRKIESSER